MADKQLLEICKNIAKTEFQVGQDSSGTKAPHPTRQTENKNIQVPPGDLGPQFKAFFRVE